MQDEQIDEVVGKIKEKGLANHVGLITHVEVWGIRFYKMSSTDDELLIRSVYPKEDINLVAENWKQSTNLLTHCSNYEENNNVCAGSGRSTEPES